jgi:16S rRNA A1518/A1519 N6-dimethyltransferase RsmA/KsgA/DIM1 with predicted DNA glycosylase/AP lyase activity
MSKIDSPPGSRSYRAVSVIAQTSFKVEKLFPIGSNEFNPKPKVSSVAIRLTPLEGFGQPFFSEKRILLLNRLFSFRGRLLSAALDKMKLESETLDDFRRKRIESLSPSKIFELISRIEVIGG